MSKNVVFFWSQFHSRHPNGVPKNQLWYLLKILPKPSCLSTKCVSYSLNTVLCKSHGVSAKKRWQPSSLHRLQGFERQNYSRSTTHTASSGYLGRIEGAGMVHDTRYVPGLSPGGNRRRGPEVYSFQYPLVVVRVGSYTIWIVQRSTLFPTIYQ